MWFRWFMLVVDLLLPVLFVLFGRLLWKCPPKRINGFWGYRTARSMKSEDAWSFAQGYCGRLWWWLGWSLLPLTAAVYILVYHCSEAVLGIAGAMICTIQFFFLLASIFFVERALKRAFPD